MANSSDNVLLTPPLRTITSVFLQVQLEVPKTVPRLELEEEEGVEVEVEGVVDLVEAEEHHEELSGVATEVDFDFRARPRRAVSTNQVPQRRTKDDIPNSNGR